MNDTDSSQVIKTHPVTAAEWRAVELALLVDVEGWNALAEAVIVQPGLPQVIAESYAAKLRRGYEQLAQAARDTAAEAAGYAAAREAATPTAMAS